MKLIKPILRILLLLCAVCAFSFSAFAAGEPPEILSLRYDDYVHIEGYRALYVNAVENRSFVVADGSVTDEKDACAAEVTKDGGIRATGIGKATVAFITEEDYRKMFPEPSQETEPSEETEPSQETAPSQETEPSGEAEPVPGKVAALLAERVELYLTSVEVTPAPISFFLLAGQSNMDGYAPSNSEYFPQDSVLCEKGQVYSTFCPRSDALASRISGLESLSACTEKNAADFVAQSLTSDTALSGKKLIYKTDALTADGNGKNGMDAGVGYMWHLLTGEKVWLVNTAWGGSAISSWIPGGSNYERTAAVLELCKKTLQAEIDSGHYTLSHTLMLWCQGGADNTQTAEYYISNFRLMMDGLKQRFGIELCGIITSRSGIGSQTNTDGLLMAGHRIAQYAMGFSAEASDTFVVSNVNEEWVSDEKTRLYFSGVYPTGLLSYPLRANANISLAPQTVADVHAQKHYSQSGHNENGLDAAKNLYNIVYGIAQPCRVYWRGADGILLDSSVLEGDGRELTLTQTDGEYQRSLTLFPAAQPMSEAKKLRFVYDEQELTYDLLSGTLVPGRTGEITLNATDADGNTISALLIRVPAFPAPDAPTTAVGSGSITVSLPSGEETGFYRLYKSTDGGEPVALTDTGEPTVTDTEVVSGHSYTYHVCLLREDGRYELSEPSEESGSVYYVSDPASLKGANAVDGAKISWKAVKGEVSYRVYLYKKGKWEVIGETEGTSFLYKEAASGKENRYTVRCISKDGQTVLGSENPKELTHTYIAPVTPTATQTEDTIKVSWKKPKGAKKFRVLMKYNNKWYNILETEQTSCICRNAKNGKRYAFRIRCIDENGKYVSSANSPAVVIYRVNPTVLKASVRKTGVRLSWKKNTAATGYLIYRSDNGGKLKKIKQLKDHRVTSYTDTKAKKSHEYKYVVVTYLKPKKTAFKSVNSNCVIV